MSDNIWGSPDPSTRREEQPATGVERAKSSSNPPGSDVARPEDIERAQAVHELKRRREFFGTLGGWASVSALTTGVWVATGADGYFWPVWPILGVGIGVVSRAAALWGPAKKEITEADIAAQMRKREERGR